MNTRCVMLPIAVVLTMLQWAEVNAAQARESSFKESYGVIVERNIFLRDRRSAAGFVTPSPASEAGAEEMPPSPPLPPEAGYVLVGVVIEDQTMRAYVEHVAEGRMLMLGPGDELAEGEIDRVTLDAVEFTSRAGSQWIEIGHNFLGQPASGSSSASTPSVSGGNPATGSNLSLEERLRLRRQQELNR